MLYEKVISPSGHSFSKRNFLFKNFPSDWHYHPEYELILISEGSGKRFVGSSVHDFYEGEIALIGANVPHFHLSDKKYYGSNDLYCCSQVIQFDKEVFPRNMDSMLEFRVIWQLLERAECGVLFLDENVTRIVTEAFSVMETLSGMELILKLYRMLDMLGHTTNYKVFSGHDYDRKHIGKYSNTPVYRVFQYLMTHFKETIYLKDIADYAGQNHSALCRSFKQSTGKSIFVCLSNIRIEFAYKLLANSDFSVTQVAFESGFTSISHFNHIFKQTSGLSPTEYRKIHRK